jgi:predicted GIY-YIG superfamily endonuclease
MKFFVYLISDWTHKNIYAGYTCSMVEFREFNKFWNNAVIEYYSDRYKHRLVYFEEVTKEGHAIDRMMYFTFLPLKNKIYEIISVNPDFIDLTTCENYDFPTGDFNSIYKRMDKLIRPFG